MAIERKSYDCMTFLVSQYSLRQQLSQSGRQCTVASTVDAHGYAYSNYLFPLLIQGKDNDSLAYLLRNEGLYFSQQDFNSFIR